MPDVGVQTKFSTNAQTIGKHTPLSGQDSTSDQMQLRHDESSGTSQQPVRRAQSTPPDFSGKRISVEKSTRLVTDVFTMPTRKHRKEQDGFSKKRSQYFEKEFACRDSTSLAKQRVVKDSIITVNIKLSYDFNDTEVQQFHCDLSFALSEVYQRPASCIMIILSNKSTLLFHGTLDPAYHITLAALAPEIAATKNKRSTHFIQQFMYENLGIPSSRGLIRFEAVKEENMATNGLTTLEEMERLELRSTPENPLRPFSRHNGRKTGKSSSLSAHEQETSLTSHSPKATRTKASWWNNDDGTVAGLGERQLPKQSGFPGLGTATTQKVRKRKSILDLLRF